MRKYAAGTRSCLWCIVGPLESERFANHLIDFIAGLCMMPCWGRTCVHVRVLSTRICLIIIISMLVNLKIILLTNVSIIISAITTSYVRVCKCKVMNRWRCVSIESWNPLDDVRRSKPHEDTADVVLTDNTMVNVMDIFNRHFHLAVGTDPNSAEALKKCRYIRRKESTSKMMHSKENTFGYSE